MIWNIYFAVLALLLGFFFATVLALGKNSNLSLFSAPCRLFIFIFRGSPLFIQFFFAYDLFVLLPRLGFDIDLGFLVVTVETRWLTKAWLGALIVLFLIHLLTQERFLWSVACCSKSRFRVSRCVWFYRD